MLFSLISRHSLRNLAVPALMINTIAAFTFLLGVNRGVHSLTLILVLLTWLAIIHETKAIPHLIQPAVSALGKNTVARAILCALGCVWAISSGVFPVFLAGAAILLSNLGETVLSRIVQASLWQSANFAISGRIHVPRTAAAVAPFNLLAIALFLACAAGLLPPIIAVIAIVLAAAACSWTLLTAAIQIRRRHRSNIRDLIRAYEPAFLLYWEAPRGAQYQVSMWLEYLERTGQKFMIVTRTRTNFSEAAQITSHPVVLRPSLSELEDVIVPSVTSVFYVNNASRNTQMIRHHQLTHVQLLHGDSDKASSYNPVMRMYDYNFVAGQAAIDRFSRHGIEIPRSIFRIVGRPQVESVLPSGSSISEITHPVVLYAPTWAGFFQDTNYSSLPWGIEIVESLIQHDCTVIFRPHPYTNRNPELAKVRQEIIKLLESDRASSHRSHVFGAEAETEMTVFDCFNASHAMVADVSAVVGDYLFSGKPFALVNTSHSPEEFTEEFPMAQAAYTWSPSEPFSPVLDQLTNTDPLQTQRLALRNYYLGDFPTQGYADHFVQAVREVTMRSRESDLPAR